MVSETIEAAARADDSDDQLERDDKTVTELIVALVTQGFFDGHTQSMFGCRQ